MDWVQASRMIADAPPALTRFATTAPPTLSGLRLSFTAASQAAYTRSRNGEPVYFRVYFVFGSVWFCWWNCFTDRYRLVTPDEAVEFAPVREIILRIASLTGMKFFSCEIAETESGEQVAIDYVNDQCHLLTQSANPTMGVPDELVAAIAQRLVEGAQQLIRQAQ
jgi:hypothetical protein